MADDVRQRETGRVLLTRAVATEPAPDSESFRIRADQLKHAEGRRQLTDSCTGCGWRGMTLTAHARPVVAPRSTVRVKY